MPVTHSPRPIRTTPTVHQVMAAVQLPPRAVPHGRGTITLPGATALDVARALDSTIERVRPVLNLMVAGGALRVSRHGVYTCYLSTEEATDGRA